MSLLSVGGNSKSWRVVSSPIWINAAAAASAAVHPVLASCLLQASDVISQGWVQPGEEEEEEEDQILSNRTSIPPFLDPPPSVITVIRREEEEEEEDPTNNALLTNFRLSSGAEVLLLSTD